MAVSAGIIGLALSGRTTVFKAATKGKAEASVAAHIGTARVPDARIARLTEMFHPKKTSYAEVRYLELGASVKGMAESNIGGEALRQLQTVDELINVVRYFKDDSVPHPQGSVDAGRDIAAMNMELTFSDLAIIEKRLNKLEGSLKSAKATERLTYQREQDLLLRLKKELETDVPIRALALSEEEEKAISGYQFLSAKPLLIVVNIGEEDLSKLPEIEAALGQKYATHQARLIALCGRLEAELAEMDEESAAAFRADYGLTETGLDRTIRASYELLSLISFFTVGPDEVKAWSIRRATIAQRAAGKIHTDIERGFIRAEVVSYEDLVKTGSLAEAKRAGVFRLEGKTYEVKDGDVINFLFNV